MVINVNKLSGGIILSKNNDCKICDMSTFRIDFSIIDYQENGGCMTIISTPNPERYILKECDGKMGYWDKLDKCFIPNEVCQKIAKNMVNLPIITPASKIKNLNNYFDERYYKLDKYWYGECNYDFSIDNNILTNFDNTNNKLFNFMSIDMVESTKRSGVLDSEINFKVINLFLNEISLIICQFEGHIFKFVGDGLIAFFTDNNLLSKIDNSLDCASTIKIFVEKYLNKFLDEKGISKIDFRIGINFGKSYVGVLGGKNELCGHDINVTCKLQKLSNNNQIIVGSNSVKLSHTDWRKKLKKIKINKRKLKKEGFDENMEIYKLNV